jgi:serine/threonine-protein phosphatase 2A regulatory subunit B'
MVYNAIKMFMEINPQLFDECSLEYNEQQSNSEQREKARRNRWDHVAELADKRKKGLAPPLKPASAPTAVAGNGPIHNDEIDPLTQESQKRLNALKLQDESSTGKERRPRDPDKQNLVSARQA